MVSWKHLFIEETSAFVPLLYHQKRFVSLAIANYCYIQCIRQNCVGNYPLLRCCFVYTGSEGFVLVF